jgi:hypothetical protein
MKKRVAVVYSGQTRSNGLNPKYTHDNWILESTNQFLLTKEFQETYEYDVFFSVDTIDVEKTKDFFGEHLKNIHLTETNWFMNPIATSIPPYQPFYDKYCSTDFNGCQTHIHGVYPYYRLFCAYHLMKDTNVSYDYVIRIRPDLRWMQDIMPLLKRIESDDKLHLIMEHDHFYIADRMFDPLLKFIERIGTFTTEVEVRNPIFKHLLKDADEMYLDHVTRFCPERQLLEYIQEIITEHNLTFKDAFLGIMYPSHYLIYRGYGQYGYAEYHENNKWTPYQRMEPLFKESYAQAYQDVFVETMMKGKRDGYYLEIGSNHPITHNNTYLLEKKYNWKGLMIEYLPSFKPLYETHRPNAQVIIQDARHINYREFLDDHQYPIHMDYLQMDLDVDNKSTLDTFLLLNETVFEKYKFATITFEHDIYTGNYFDTQSISRKILEDRGYRLVFPNVSIFWGDSYKAFEDWYVHPDLVDMTHVTPFITHESLSCDKIKTILKESIRI